MKEEIIVIKKDITGKETRRWTGHVLSNQPDGVTIKTVFSWEDVEIQGFIFRYGDRFIEQYYANRWYNIFEVYDKNDNHLKGWYCNIAHPAIITTDTISFVDLALDLLVFPDGRQMILDEEEFLLLEMAPETIKNARNALGELMRLFNDNHSVSMLKNTLPGRHST